MCTHQRTSAKCALVESGFPDVPGPRQVVVAVVGRVVRSHLRAVGKPRYPVQASVLDEEAHPGAVPLDTPALNPVRTHTTPSVDVHRPLLDDVICEALEIRLADLESNVQRDLPEPQARRQNHDQGRDGPATTIFGGDPLDPVRDEVYGESCEPKEAECEPAEGARDDEDEVR